MAQTIETAECTETSVLIIGAGFAGLGMGITLRRSGREDFLILEKNPEVGGTWWDNRYPGCACDVQSHLYSYSFEPNPNWSRMFSQQPEILDYLKHCTDKYGLRPFLRCNTEVAEVRYDETSQQWQVRDTQGRRYRAQSVVACLGGLSTASTPELPGLQNFKGTQFHSQQWDQSCDLQGKRVAVIGTGASAIQFVPEIAPQAGQLDLYQRTAPWVLPKPDRAMAAFERSWFRRWPWVQRRYRRAIYWLRETQAFGFILGPWVLRLAQVLGHLHIRRQVNDPALRRKLTPNFVLGCKRVLLSSNYYPTFNLPQVKLVTDGIREVRSHSIVTEDGTERDVDVLIYGTGFKATEPLQPGVVFGREGRDLAEEWSDGPQAYKGCTVSGFPNLFLVPGPNTGLGHGSMVFMIESLLQYVQHALALLREKGGALEVRRDAQDAYNRKLEKKMRRTVWTTGGCRSWYMHHSGRNTALWPSYTWHFRLATRRFDSKAYLPTQSSGS